MPESPTTPETSIAAETSRRRWRWLIGAAVVCLIALVIAVGVPAYQSVQFLRFVDAQGGSFEIEYNHPTWMSGWIDEKAYIPGLDRVRTLNIDEVWGGFSDVPISQSQFNTILGFSGLKELTIDVSNCDPQTLSQLNLSQLKELKQLEWLTLSDVSEDSDLGWVSELPELTGFRVQNRLLSREEWQSIQSHPKNERVIEQQRDYYFLMDRMAGSEEWEVVLSGELSSECGRKLLERFEVKKLVLTPTSVEPEFWELLSQHKGIETLNLHYIVGKETTEPSESGIAYYRLTKHDYKSIQKMPALKQLELEDHLYHNTTGFSLGLDIPEELHDLQKNRHDIEIIME